MQRARASRGTRPHRSDSHLTSRFGPRKKGRSKRIPVLQLKAHPGDSMQRPRTVTRRARAALSIVTVSAVLAACGSPIVFEGQTPLVVAGDPPPPPPPP